MKIWQSLSLGEFFSSWKGDGFVVKLLAAKVIRQHMFLFTLSYFLVNNLWNKKRYDIFSPWKSRLNVTPVQDICSGFDHANLASSFRGFKYLPKVDSWMCFFFKYEQLKRFVWEDDNILACKRKIRKIGRIFRNGGDRWLLQMCNGRKTDPSTYFFSTFSYSFI